MQLSFKSCNGRIWPAVFLGTFVALGLGFGARIAQAQNLFAPAITVNDSVITNYELDQRIKFLKLLRAPGVPEDAARKALIDDRLRQQVIKRNEIVVSEEDVAKGVAEFAARTQLSADEFLRLLGQGGVDPETMRDFVKVSLGWREFVRGKFVEAARPSPIDIERALAKDNNASGVSVLLSEVIIPMTPDTAEQAMAIADDISAIRSYDAFAEAARQYSASDTRDNGGKLEWLALANLPAPLQPQILALNPGEVTQPIPLPNAVAVFQLRGIQEIVGRAPQYASIDYAAYYIAGGRSPEALATAAALRNKIDRCDDLYAVAQGQPPEVLERQSVAPGALPRDFALELAKLDMGEVSTSLTRSNGQTLVFLMLCNRVTAANKDVSRDDMANALIQQNLQSLSETYLGQIRADALIIEE